MSNNEVRIYTDGSCKPNPGKGGYAALIISDGEEIEITGSDPRSTNNRMEMTAALMALRQLPDGASARVFSDSELLVLGAKERLAKWKQNGWRTAHRKPVENRELWELLDAEFVRLEVKWEWVRGHDRHPENDRVDALAGEAAERQAGVTCERRALGTLAA